MAVIDELEANAFAKARRIPGVSQQTFALRKAIMQLDAVAHDDGRVYEVHPELSFSLIHSCPIISTKASWNGVMERRRLLASVGLDIPDHLGDAGVAGVADLPDACAAAWSASQIAGRSARRFPLGEERIGGIWG